ncbi:MAG TPA: DUF397 domain-containing protein [Pseudonocardiaceae bacterium]|nr:DUF397 domain-containing protein [Pseudonocardiaceae bacterium]
MAASRDSPRSSSTNNLAWRKSSRSSGGDSNCVEVASSGLLVAVRDSKRPGPVLVVPADAWRAFVGRTK